MKKIVSIIIAVVVVIGIAVLLLIGFKNNKNDSNQNNDKENTNKNTEATEEVSSIKDNSIYFVNINGTKFKAGDKISSVSKVNLKQKDKDLDEKIPKNRYLLSKSVVNSDNKEICKFVPLNSTDSTITVKDSVIGGFEVGEINYNKISNETLSYNIEIVGGIKLGSSYDDIVRVFGKEDTKYESKTDEKYNMPSYTVYDYSSGYKGFSFTIDDSGKLSKIEWNDYNYDE